MDTLPLPGRPDIGQYRKRAKELVRAAAASDPSVLRAWRDDWLAALRRALDPGLSTFVRASMDRAIDHIVREAQRRAAQGQLALADAQMLIAGAHGFSSWSRFHHELGRLGKGSERDPFEVAADAVVDGDADRLSRMLSRDPALARARSARVHHATLLHYVAANGVEDFRQRSPANAADIAQLLLDAGAEVDALADTYDGGWWQTTMNLLVSSAHPAAAGVQAALVAVLADAGAALNGLRDDESPLMTALDFGYSDAAKELVRRGARVDCIVTGAALGRVDLVDRFVIDASTLAPGVPLAGPPWRRMPTVARDHIALAFVWACKFGHEPAARALLEKGVDPAARDGYRMTALHYAAANGLTVLVDDLIRRGAPLEAKNQWGGTVLDSTIHMALHSPVPAVDYPRVIGHLLGAGADPNAVALPTGDATIDALLRSARPR